MKKPHIWAGIIGGLVTISKLYFLVGILNNPSGLPRVDIALAAGHLSWVVFGAFLLWFFFVEKDKQETENLVTTKHTSNSPEDIERLQKIQNWILVVIIFLGILGAVPMYVLHTYASTLTPVNTQPIFDLLINTVLFYFAIQLLRGKSATRNPLLIAAMISVLVHTALSYLRVGGVETFVNLPALFFFGFVIMTKTSRTTFRIANFIILPITVATILALSFLTGTKMGELVKREAELERVSQVQNSLTAQAYTVFLQKNNPTDVDIQNVKDTLDKGAQTLTNILTTIDKARTEYQKQLSNPEQQIQLARLDNLEAFFRLNVEQGNKMREFMNYASTVNFSNLSQEQAMKLSSFKKSVDDFSTGIARAAYRVDNNEFKKDSTEENQQPNTD